MPKKIPITLNALPNDYVQYLLLQCFVLLEILRIRCFRCGCLVVIGFGLGGCSSPLLITQPTVNESATLRKVPDQNNFSPYTIDLSGEWLFRRASISSVDPAQLEGVFEGWRKIHVPANWYLEGENFSGAAWYQRKFSIPDSLEGKSVQLSFSGVDYMADVWLNGRHLGFHEGYFQPFSFSVPSQLLKAGEENSLLVRVDSPFEEPGQVWSLKKRLIKGVLSHHDTRPGGAWSVKGQDQNTGGIWAGVALHVSNQVSLKDVRISPHLSEDKPADADISLILHSVDAQAVKVRFELIPKNFSSPAISPLEIEYSVVAGDNKLSANYLVNEPSLWWPAGYGNPNLYRLIITVLKDGQVLDRDEQQFGFRTVVVEPLTKTWLVNGHRLFLRGTNYISSQWLSEMTDEKYVQDIGLMKQANINAVRVHAHVEAAAFYQHCDEAGMLVWQDFPLQWGYSDAPDMTQEAVRQVKEMIAMLYNHPSIIAWTLHNEPPWDADWMRYKYPDYQAGQNRLLDQALFAAASQEDGTRYVHPYSSTAEHRWAGWYSGSWRDHGKPTDVALISEFGAQALPNIESLRKIFNESELWPTTSDDWAKWEYHNFQKRETFDIAKVLMGENIYQFISNTQSYQAKLLQYAAESYRRQRFSPVTAAFQFMFVEDWPSANWGVLDYWRQPKAGYYALRKAFQPVLPSIEWERENYKKGEAVKLNVWVINDLWQSFPDAKLIYSLRHKGVLIEENSLPVDVVADSGKIAVKWKKLGLGVGEYEFNVRIEVLGKVLGQNTFTFIVAN
jgi:beta-mannosidase